MDRLRRNEIAADVAERSYLQWAMIRSLAFGERDWMTICAVLFALNGERDFLTAPGLACFILGVLFLGPVFGLFIYYAGRLVYLRLKAGRRLPVTARGLKGLTWIANLLCFPAILFSSWKMFNLFYDSYDSLVVLLMRTAGPLVNG